MYTRILQQLTPVHSARLAGLWMCRGVALTSTRYPHLRRKNFANLSDQDLHEFKAIVGSDNVIQSDLDAYNTDWLKTVKGEV